MNIRWALLLAVLITTPLLVKASGNPLNRLEVSGILLDGENSVAVLYEIQSDQEWFARIGSRWGECVVADIQRQYVHMECSEGEYSLRISANNARRGAVVEELPQEAQMLQVKDQESIKVLSDTMEFISSLRLTPYSVKGQVKGYRIAHIATNGLAETLDLQQDDLITSIRGIPATQSMDFLRALRDLSDSGVVEMEIQREGNILHKTFILER